MTFTLAVPDGGHMSHKVAFSSTHSTHSAAFNTAHVSRHEAQRGLPEMSSCAAQDSSHHL